MGKASLAQEKRDMVFEEVYGVWTEQGGWSVRNLDGFL